MVKDELSNEADAKYVKLSQGISQINLYYQWGMCECKSFLANRKSSRH